MSKNMDDMNDEEMMRLFEEMFMTEIGGIKGIDVNKGSIDPELFEQMLRDLILPHLMVGGVAGDITNAKLIRIRGGEENKPKLDDMSWLDKYL